jgi:hypothetical protein
MAKISADPLKCIPSADEVRRRLTEAERQAMRLRILLDVAEKIERERRETREAANAS